MANVFCTKQSQVTVHQCVVNQTKNSEPMLQVVAKTNHFIYSNNKT